MRKVESQVDSVEAQLSDLQSRTTALQNRVGMSSGQAMAVSSIKQSPLVQGVLEDYRDVERNLTSARARYREGHPIITQLKDKEAQIKNLLQAQVAKVLKGEQIWSTNKLQH